MATCRYCKQEMLGADSCTDNETVMFPDGTKLPTIKWEPDEEGRRCDDCNVAPGGFHHPGCDIERCPKCGGQIISCGCLDDEDDEDIVEYSGDLF